MSSQRFTPEFKDEAVRQIVDRGKSYKRPRQFATGPIRISMLVRPSMCPMR